MKQIWIVSVCPSTDYYDPGILILRVIASKERIKEYLLTLVKNDRKDIQDNKYDEWCFGAEKVEDIREVWENEFYTCACYECGHIDYQATLEQTPITLKEK